MLELLVEFISVLVGIFCYPKLSIAFRIIVFQLCLAFAVEFTGYLLVMNKASNTWLFNFYIIIEAILLLFAAYKMTGFDLKFFFLLVVPLFFWWLSIYQNGLNYFTSIACVCFSIAILVVYLYVLFKSVVRYRGDLLLMPILWMSIGLILFFGCNIPYLLMLNYVYIHFGSEVNKSLLFILNSLCNLRYILVCVSLVLAYRQNKFEHAG